MLVFSRSAEMAAADKVKGPPGGVRGQQLWVFGYFLNFIYAIAATPAARQRQLSSFLWTVLFFNLALAMETLPNTSQKQQQQPETRAAAATATAMRGDVQSFY